MARITRRSRNVLGNTKKLSARRLEIDYLVVHADIEATCCIETFESEPINYTKQVLQLEDANYIIFTY